MSVTFGPTSWWVRSKEAADYYARICPVGTILPDGSAVYRRFGGQSWIVAPASTEICDQWASNRYPSTLVGREVCCICEWTDVCCRLVSCGFNPCDWFIPTYDILFTSWQCRAYWDTCSCNCYWSSTEISATTAEVCGLFSNFPGAKEKNTSDNSVRSVRCINLF